MSTITINGKVVACDHEWEHHECDDGDGIYHQTSHWMECAHCGETRLPDEGDYGYLEELESP